MKVKSKAKGHRPSFLRRYIVHPLKAVWAWEWTPALGVLAAFLVSRLWLLLRYTPMISDIPGYFRRYDAFRKAASVQAFFDSKTFEYPPLASIPILGPGWLADQVGTASVESFRTIFRSAVFGADLLLFALLPFLLRRVFPKITRWGMAWRLGLYAVIPLFQFDIYYDRLDVFVALALVLSLLLLAYDRLAAGALMLGLACAFKLTPALLVPALLVWLWQRAEGDWRRLRWGVPIWGVGGFLLGIVPFLLALGSGCLYFTQYHSERGIQLESFASNAALLGKALADYPVKLMHKWGSFGINFPDEQLAMQLGTAAVLIVIAAVGGLLWWRRRAMRAEMGLRLVALAGLVTLMWAMIFAKVFSPQYLFWLIPFVLILPLSRPMQLVVAVAFAALFGLSTEVFPMHYGALKRFEPLGVELLSARNGLFLLTTLFLSWQFWRILRREAAAAEQP